MYILKVRAVLRGQLGMLKEAIVPVFLEYVSSHAGHHQTSDARCSDYSGMLTLTTLHQSRRLASGSLTPYDVLSHKLVRALFLIVGR